MKKSRWYEEGHNMYIYAYSLCDKTDTINIINKGIRKRDRGRRKNKMEWRKKHFEILLQKEILNAYSYPDSSQTVNTCCQSRIAPQGKI